MSKRRKTGQAAKPRAPLPKFMSIRDALVAQARPACDQAIMKAVTEPRWKTKGLAPRFEDGIAYITLRWVGTKSFAPAAPLTPAELEADMLETEMGVMVERVKHDLGAVQ